MDRLPRVLRWIGYAGVVCLLGVYVFFAFAGPSPITSIPGTQQKIEVMRENNRKLREKIKQKSDYLDEVESNPSLRDREFRKRFNKQKPGETTIWLPDSE